MPMISSDLLILMAKFNWLPASYVDASWLTPWLSPPQLAAITANPEATRTLNRFLLEQPEVLEEVPAESFADPMLQLLLLPGNTFRQVVLYAGLALNHHRIRQIICGQQQREIKKSLGIPGYRFALERAPFMAGSLCKAINLDEWEFLGGEETRAAVFDSGLKLLSLASNNLLKPAIQRMLYFFDKKDAEKIQSQWQVGFRAYVNDVHQILEVQGRAQGLLLKIAQEINPQWKPVTV
ncbi:hypothetical protein BTA51_04925 [Hahella sp. CCB-MM4]|uniref:SctK family type III secretion system sorting platform protein n=1 Tax=Hahella sp. (strain CCB-MM4) TaxID=1926491 RepID=UPI000B9C22A8|nr:SctK family type III secretion system sorting platform protein [Hahella sp. CCB-MM4]OZG74358.1 hypothetical protein BTA51_04925 [Hahella sp. CCB-MM4]